MIRRASLAPFVLLVFIFTGAAAAADAPVDLLPADGTNALKAEYDKGAGQWTKLLNGDPADPSNPLHQQAVDAAAKWTTYRLTWGLERDPGKITEIYREFNDALIALRNGKDKTQKTAEMYAKQVTVHALEVLQTRRAVARINAARLLDRLAERVGDETPADVLARLAGTNEADLADALGAVIKDPNQIDPARLYAFKGMRALLALPPQSPPALTREKEEALLGTVVQFLKDRNKPLPPGTPDDEIDGFQYLRREAIRALEQGRYPTLTTLADKPRVAWTLLKVVARDGIAPDPRLDERIEAAIGVAHLQPDLDRDYQPDYAAHQLGLFVADFAAQYAQAKQGGGETAVYPWKVDASRLIEALELMKAQSKNAHVTRVADESLKLLTKIEKALPPPNPFDLEQALAAEASPGQQIYKGVAESVVKPANRKDAAAPDKPETGTDK